MSVERKDVASNKWRVKFSRVQIWVVEVDVDPSAQHHSIAAINQARQLVDDGAEPSNDQGLMVLLAEKIEPSGA